MSEAEHEYQIECDGKTLWINHAMYGAVGRFSPNGVDVHSPENDKCVGCGPTPDWDDFVQKMEKVHGVDVSAWKENLRWLK